MTNGQKTALTWLAIGGGAFLLYYLAKREVTKAAEAVNPLNPANVFNTAANDVYGTLTGSQGSIGTDIYNFLHPKQFSPSGPATPQCFYRDANGNLMYDSTGTIMSGPCAPGDVGTTLYPGT